MDSVDSAKEKNLEIEYLRAIAVVLVVAGHLPALLPFHGGEVLRVFAIFRPWTGVDLFFCISGYVVSKSLVEFLDEHAARGNFWLAAQCFWIRRFYRLLPSAWAWMLIVLFCSVFFNTTGVFNSWWQNLRSITAIMTFSGNLANQFGMLLTPNDVYWSLALEEQFYLFFPLFLLVTSGAWRWRILLALIVAQFFIDRNPFGTPFSVMASSFRVDPIMWGVLIFIFSRSAQYRLFEPVFLGKSRLATLGFNLLLIYLLGAIPAQLIAMPLAHGLISLVSAMYVFMAVYRANYVMPLPMLSGFMAWLGSRSYAIYLIHIPAYRMTYEGWSQYAAYTHHALGPYYTPFMALTALTLIVVLAELNYHLIENPLRKRGARLAGERLKRWPTLSDNTTPTGSSS